MNSNAQVFGYINSKPITQRVVLIRLREIILATKPAISEKFKMGVPWYDECFYLVALKDHVNMGFALGNKEIVHKLEGKGKYMRHLKFYSQQDINQEELKKLIQQAEPTK